jgi:GNAT superfamily N-acetyltransferase
MSLFSEYIKEKLDKNTIEDERGFITYFFTDKGCVAEDLYVKPDFRRQGVATELVDAVFAIAKEKGCKKVFTGTIPTAKDSTESIKFILAYGFKLSDSTHNYIMFSKEIV